MLGAALVCAAASPGLSASSDPAKQPATTAPAAAQPAPAIQPKPAAQPARGVQTSAPSQTITGDRVETAQSRIDQLKTEIDRIATQLQNPGLTDKELAALRTEADSIKTRSDALATEQAPELEGATARLKQLGPAPQATNGEPAPLESDAVRAERDAQQKAVAQLEGVVKQAKLISIDADEITKTVSDRRRTRFAETLTERTRSMLDPALWVEAVIALPATMMAFQYMVSDWFGLVASHGGDVAIAFLCVLVAIIILLITPLRRHLFRLVSRDENEIAPARLRKVIAAAGVAAIQVGAPLVGFLILMLALQALELTRDRIDQAFLAFIEASALGNAIFGLGVAILAPAKSQWRLVRISDQAAIVLRRVFTGLAIATGIGLFLTRMLDILSTSISLVFAASGASAIIDAVFSMLALHVISRAVIEAETEEGEDGTPTQSETGARVNFLWRWLLPIAWLAAVACVGSAVLGYVSLARFIGQQMIWIGVVMATLYIVLQVIDELVTAAFLQGSTFSNAVSRSMAISHETVEQIGVLLSGIGRVLAIFIAAYFVRPPWADTSYDVITSLKAAFFGFKVGNFIFSPASLLLALISFAIGVAITRGVQRWLDNHFLPRTRLDLGLKNSISTGIGYAGYVVAAIVAFSAVGVGLENVALVAGALSVGIGFGLQSIVNNFVSGLILLAERPIKSGDLVQIGTEKGYVRKINVRSTEIETFDRASLIVPNSTLISGAVKNWMHRDPSGQVLVIVGVDYETDVDQVRDIMLTAAKAHRLVQAFPGPSVTLIEFGAKALEFQLACTVGNVNDVWNVQSDLRIAILKRFRKDGIDMPSAQRDIWVRGLDDLPALVAALARQGDRAEEAKPGETTEAAPEPSR